MPEYEQQLAEAVTRLTQAILILAEVQSSGSIGEPSDRPEPELNVPQPLSVRRDANPSKSA